LGRNLGAAPSELHLHAYGQVELSRGDVVTWGDAVTSSSPGHC
jgi:hypothetical protein